MFNLPKNPPLWFKAAVVALPAAFLLWFLFWLGDAAVESLKLWASASARDLTKGDVLLILCLAAYVASPNISITNARKEN